MRVPCHANLPEWIRAFYAPKLRYDRIHLECPVYLAKRLARNCPGGPFPHDRVPGLNAGHVEMVPLDWLPLSTQMAVKAVIAEAGAA